MFSASIKSQTRFLILHFQAFGSSSPLIISLSAASAINARALASRLSRLASNVASSKTASFVELPSLDIDLVGLVWVEGREIECGVRGSLEERGRVEVRGREKVNACRIIEVSMVCGITHIIG